VHYAVQGFEESMPCLFDTDYCFKIQLKGIKLNFAPNALIHIRTPSTIRNIYRKALSNDEFNVLLYKRYRPLGMAKLSAKSGLYYWLSVVRQIYRLRSRSDLCRLTWTFGWGIGHLKGSVRWRVLAL
jgi:GT2 family glycosyltransferase